MKGEALIKKCENMIAPWARLYQEKSDHLTYG
jgi:hypothetical protein